MLFGSLEIRKLGSNESVPILDMMGKKCLKAHSKKLRFKRPKQMVVRNIKVVSTTPYFASSDHK